MAEGDDYCTCKHLSLLFRLFMLILSVAAVLLMATASQQALVDGGGPAPSSHSTVVHIHHKPLQRYFVAASAISTVCSAAALYLFAACANATGISLPLVALFDAAAQGFLFSAAGAALVARVMLEGSSVCDAAGTFCSRVNKAAIVYASAAVFAAGVALARDAANGVSEGRRGDC